MQLKSNTELQGGKYRIIRVLGQGGFGITYLAENIYFDKKVAIKEFFPRDYCGRDNTSHVTLGTQNNADTVTKLKARFLKEAKNIAKLNHPGIVKIHDIFEENDTAYYVMDYIEGANLNDIVKHNGALPETRAIEYIAKVGNALDCIHSHNMTHFDVKPANIVVRQADDEPILIDFGLSKQYDASGDATSTIMQGVSHGFSPIELYNAGSVATFSPQTDVYSLGATLYFLISGKTPPTASQVLEEGVSLPNSTSQGVSSAINRAMSVNRIKRYKSVKNFCRSLTKSTAVSENICEPEESNIPLVDNNESEQTQLYRANSNTAIEDTPRIQTTAKNEDSEQCPEDVYEENVSMWMRFINWFCEVGELVNANKIPFSKKVSYYVALIPLTIVAAFVPFIGWLYAFATHKYLRHSLQRLFFEEYLDEWDDAAEYSKAKAITLITLSSLIPVLTLIWIFIFLFLTR